MAAFPTLTPSSRTFTPGEYPRSVFAGISGIQGRVRNSNVMLSSQVRLTFAAITEAQMLLILTHYQGQQGTFQSFPLPSSIWSGANDATDYQLTGYGWRYIESPNVSDAMCANAYNVELTLETVPPEGTAISGLDFMVFTSLLAGTASAQFSFVVAASLASGTATGSSGSTDPDFASVSLLLHMDGSNGSTTFTDSSANGVAVTSTGGTVSTADFKFGTGSLRIQQNQYITTVSSSLFAFPGDFTIELWVKCDASQPAQYLTLFELGLYTNGILFRDDALYINNTIVKSNTGLQNTSWRHIAITRSGTTVRLFYDGASQSLSVSTISGTINSGNDAVRFGEARHTTQQPLAGYIDEVRITKGVARYTADFTPPTAPFPDS